MSERYYQFVTKHPVKVLLFALLVLAAAAAGIPKLSFKSDLRIYFSPENPQIHLLDQMEETYTKVDNVLFVFAPKDGVFNPRVLDMVEKVTAKAWKIPYSSRVDSVTNFKHSTAQGDDIAVDDLVVGAQNLNAEQIAEIRTAALNDPLILNRTISADGKVTGINVTINIPKGKELSSVPVVVKYVRTMADEIRAEYPDVELHLSGVVMMDNAFAEASEHDMKTLVPAMLTLALVVMGWIMGSVTASIAALLILTCSIVAAMGLAGWFGVLLNPVSINAPNIILTIAVCDCVHLLMGYLATLRAGTSKQEAMVKTLRSHTRAIVITSVTTGVGFLSLNTSDAPPFRDIGNITAFGAFAALFFTLTLLPAMMMLVKVKAKSRDVGGASRMHTMMDGLADQVCRRPGAFLLGSLAITAILSIGIVRNELNDEFVKYFDTSIEFRRDTDFISQHLTGIYYIDYEISGRSESGVNDPNYLRTLEEFTAWLRQQDEVLHVNSITDIFKRLNTNMHGDDPGYYKLPESQELAAQYLLMYEMSLPYGLDLRDRINAGKTASRVTATLKNLSSTGVLAFNARAQAWLKQHDSHIRFSDGTGLTIMFATIGMSNVISSLVGIVIEMLVISTLLIFVFRSVKYGVLSLIPNVLPALAAFGVWGFLVGQVGMALSVVASMTLGIVVDDTVHMVSDYLHGRRELGLDAPAAVKYAFSHIGTAVVTTSVALTAGFAVLGFSSFEISAGMGILTALAIAIALPMELTLLPALLILIDRKRHTAPTTDTAPPITTTVANATAAAVNATAVNSAG